MANEIMQKIECEGGYYYKHPAATVEQGAVIGAETKIWADAHIFVAARIGASCVLGAGVHVESNVQLGSYSKVQRGVVLYNGVRTGDYVFFGPNATTTNDRNPRAFGDWEKEETIIGTGASIGANATLIAGNEIGPLALVGAGAVVAKPVPGGQAVGGNPAEFMGWVDVSGHIVSKDQEIPSNIREMLDNPELAIVKYLSRGNLVDR